MCVVNSISDVSQNTQLASRDYWVNINHTGLDLTLHYPKQFFISSETNNYVEHRAPLIGEHNREIYRQKLGFSDFDIKNLVTANVI